MSRYCCSIVKHLHFYPYKPSVGRVELFNSINSSYSNDESNRASFFMISSYLGSVSAEPNTSSSLVRGSATFMARSSRGRSADRAEEPTIGYSENSVNHRFKCFLQKLSQLATEKVLRHRVESIRVSNHINSCKSS